MSGLFPPLPGETRKILNSLPRLIDEVFPLPARFRSGLKRDVAELSRLLTFRRTDRSGSYLGKPALLSAYLRYFLPWNIYRLSRLFSALPLKLNPHDAVNDLGAGPLTLAASLWISRPELRKIPLEFRNLDRTAAVLEAGKKFFAALAAKTSGESACPWTLRTIKAELKKNGSLSAEIKGKPAALSAAINIYNEMFWDFSPHDTEKLESFAKNQARLLSSITDSSGSALVVEPGIPRSGEFISLLRSAFLQLGRFPLSPCTHIAPCPMPAGYKPGEKKAAAAKARWCHFSFDTEDAPAELHKLSAAALIPKERAVLSFFLAGQNEKPVQNSKQEGKPVKTRIISDCFPAGGFWGRYGCCERGLVLASGNRERVESSSSGALEELQLLNGAFDEKSGALIGRLE